MRGSARWMLGWSVLAGAVIAGPAGAQRAAQERFSLARSTGEPVTTQSHAHAGATTGELYVMSALVAPTAAVISSPIGWAVDVSACEQREYDEGAPYLGCLFYAGAASKSMWLAGGAFGATTWASRAAQRRGCPARRAWRGALGGALLGSLPGAVAAANGPGTAPALIAVTPVLSGRAAATAVAGCRGPRYAAASG